MSTVSIQLSANTATYVKRIREARSETDRNIIRMEQRLDRFASDVNNNFQDAGSSVAFLLSTFARIPGGAAILGITAITVAAGVAAAAIRDIGLATVEAQREIEQGASYAGVAAAEYMKLAAAAKTVGMQQDQLRDTYKDFSDRIGDYMSTGGGALQDFFDVVGSGSEITAASLSKMSGQDGLQAVVNELERVGASKSQIIFVMESLATESSKLYPLLKNNGKALAEWNKLMEMIPTTPLISQETIKNINYLDKSMTNLNATAAAFMNETLDGVHDKLGHVLNFFSTGLKGLTYGMQKDDIFDMAAKVDLDMSGLSDTEIERTLDVIRALHQELGQPPNFDKTSEEYKEWMKTATQVADLQHKLRSERDLRIAENAGIGTEGNKPFEFKETNDFTELDNQIEANRKAFESIEDLARDHAEKINELKELNVDGSKDAEITAYEGHLEQMVKSLQNYNKQHEDLTKQRAKKEQEILFENRQKEIDMMIDDTERAKAQHQLDLDQYKFKLDNKLMSQKLYNLSVAKSEHELAETLKTIEATKNDEILRKQIEALDRKIAMAVTDEQRLKLQAEKEIAISNATLTDKSDAAEAEKLIKMNLHNDLLAMEKIKKAEELEFKASYAETEAEQDQLLYEAKLERLDAQFLTDEINYKEHLKRKNEADKEYQEAKSSLSQQDWQNMEDSLSKLESNLEEGSNAQKAAFVAAKAAAIGNIIVNGQEALSEIESSKGSDASKAIRKTAQMISTGAQVATVAAQTIGQFHSGADEVDQTGSYILQSGERVVQKTANQDLTAYLKNNKAGSAGGMTVNAGMTIEGDTQIDEARFRSMLVQHRENVVQAVRYAERENPSLRR